ncbi:hypothetical protein F511_35385 [Dorcoceras hygrometricum]|uniref:C2H2-type domain-containing protein n=1 Tax=Dorcoceras hygrometricum TaxID=472368 RepID=A0A2Z7AJ08_9LAMI|nr:hypothetical protein F511_35385 [Dorcoceras hygrometricum]
MFGNVGCDKAYRFFKLGAGMWSDGNLLYGNHAYYQNTGSQWLFAHKKLMTLDRQPYILDKTFTDAESFDHIFFRCNFVNAVWTKILEWLGITYMQNSTALLKMHRRKLRGNNYNSRFRCITIAAAIYQIWNQRNRCLFEDDSLDVLTVCAEVKSGEAFKVVPGDGMILHMSQASLGETKKEKGHESVCLFVNVEGKKLVLGTLFSDKLPQQQFDLMDNYLIEFYSLTCLISLVATELSEGESDDSESEEDIPKTLAANGKAVQKAKPEKPAEAEKAVGAKGKDSNTGKQKVQIVEPPKGAKPQDDDDDDESDDDMMSEDEDDSEGEDDEDDSDDESDEIDEETPKKVEPSKKRPAESKTPVSDKKAKVTPQKSDDKKGGVHVATPYPKQASKTPANKPNQQTPKGGGSSHSCKTCNRTFGSDKALESHSKAKHGGEK